MKPPKSHPATAPSKAGPTVVGIGASAGGLAALKTFFSHVPPDSGLAFVVVVHLSPDHKSHLAELLQPHVKTPVEQVSETTALEPNRVYVIPPNANLSAIDTHLRLSKLEEKRIERAPIDHFLRTLARTHDGNGIGVILTGTGSDGTLGIRDIKASGGLVIVQDPNEAEFDGMPQSAVATGLADLVLPLESIPDAILRFARTKPKVPVPVDGEEVPATDRQVLQKIFAHLRARTDRDFSRYKQSTVMRRVKRRMQLNFVEDFPGYLERLRERPDEARALADDMLITVTHFFRDPEVFQRLEKVELPRLFAGKGREDTVRIWSVGCATGEEAYSLAMLVAEAAGKLETPPNIQVFASDMHARSLERAREGFYPGDIAADVGEVRLKRFFHQESGGYRIRKELRDLVVFTPHNIMADPPFSRQDLISCRNLLIYLDRDVQRDVIEIFHYALNPEGILLLGSAETLESTDLFLLEEKKLCLFRKRNVPVPEPRLPVFPLTHHRAIGAGGLAPQAFAEPMSYGRLHQQMVEIYAPPSILISADNKLIHVSEHAGRYLTHPGGEPTASVLKLVRQELRVELQSSLHAAREKKRPVDSTPVEVQFNGHSNLVVLHVRPALEPQPDGYALIIFEERDGTQTAVVADSPPSSASDALRIKDLESELAQARQRLQTIIEEYETSQEEMKASSEEMQSTNEELRSTMEELETSKEELQSINEELQTVNQQSRHKVEELAQMTSDLQNLLAATDIATLFLDRDLRILRFTPKLGDLFSVRISDRGRPIADLTTRLGYIDLRKDAEDVLRHLIPAEREVQDDAGRWYLTRVLPYRSAEDRIEGVVITFVDIDSRKRAEDALRRSEQHLRHMVGVDAAAVAMFDATGTLTECDPACMKMTGHGKEDLDRRKVTWRTLTPPEHVEETEVQWRGVAAAGRMGPYEKELIRKDGSRFWVVCAGASLEDGSIVEYYLDISDRKRAESQLIESKHYAENLIETLHEPLLVLTPDLKVHSANPAFHRHFGLNPEQTIGRSVADLAGGEWNIPILRQLVADALAGRTVKDFEVDHKFKGLGRRAMIVNARRLNKGELILLGVRDITAIRKTEMELDEAEGDLRVANEALRRANADLKHFSYAVSHDMQEPLRMVISYTQLLDKHLKGSLNADVKQYIAHAVEGAERMELLLRDMREYWSVDEKKVEKTVRVDCNAVLDRALGLLEHPLEKSRVLIRRGPLPTVQAEEWPVLLLFQNLLSNSLKYSRADVPTEIQVTAHRNAVDWHISVEDNGIGIPAEFREAIFAPFKRLHGREYPGTGLGLAICQKIVERYRGRIWVQSTYGQGSTFHFTLPAMDGE